MRLSYERELNRQGFKFIAGIDEVGRGPLAGPIVAAAVILPPVIDLPGLTDSKLLSPKQREILFLKIKHQAIAVGLGKVSHRTIDQINIWQANLLAMKLAVEGLKCTPDFLLMDGGRYRLALATPQRGITGGDRKCASIAAASIIAKVTRDRLMLAYDEKYPAYGFAQHKGYGTKKHFQKLVEYGPCPIHRRSFFPMKTADRRATEKAAPS
jgi:ribonuclease HII